MQHILTCVRQAQLYETHMDEVVSVLARSVSRHHQLMVRPEVWAVLMPGGVCDEDDRVYSRIVDCKNLYDFLTRQLPAANNRQLLANRITLQTFRCNTINMTGATLPTTGLSRGGRVEQPA